MNPTTSRPLAPERFASWLNQHQHRDKNDIVYRYHPRSDAHSKKLAEYIWEDLVAACGPLREDFRSGRILPAINFRYTWAGTHKEKTIDLAVGRASAGTISEVLISCELKANMTEHKKSQPRIYDELSSSHVIVHTASPSAIAAGLTVVNIAETFISPLRQRQGMAVFETPHRQPYVAHAMVEHLRGLQQRTSLENLNEVGFDAYSTFIVDCDNTLDSETRLWTLPPAPQPGNLDHYDTFIDRITTAYTQRFTT